MIANYVIRFYLSCDTCNSLRPASVILRRPQTDEELDAEAQILAERTHADCHDEAHEISSAWFVIGTALPSLRGH